MSHYSCTTTNFRSRISLTYFVITSNGQVRDGFAAGVHALGADEMDCEIENARKIAKLTFPDSELDYVLQRHCALEDHFKNVRKRATRIAHLSERRKRTLIYEV